MEKTIKSPVIDSDLKEILSRDLPWEAFYGTTVLVTGGSGMLPSYVAYTLLKLNDLKDAGIHVIALVRNQEKAKKIFGELITRKDFSLLNQDVCSPIHYAEPIDYIFHGASAARPALHKSEPTATIKANLQGTFNLLDLAVAKESKGFMLMSSAEVYGQVNPNISLIHEGDYGATDILNPRSCYSEGKRAAETICATYNSRYGVNCKIARLGHIYGPGLALDDGRVQADFAADVMAGRDIVLNSDGSAMRTYTYVADAVAGMFTILLKGDKMAYNVANENGMMQIRDLARHFVDARPEKGLQLKFNVKINPDAGYSTVKAQGLSSEALQGLGWKALVQIEDGLDRMISNYEFEAKA